MIAKIPLAVNMENMSYNDPLMRNLHKLQYLVQSDISISMYVLLYYFY